MEKPQETDVGKLPATMASTPSFESRELFRGHREVYIEHAGQCYRLQITRLNKLILTK